RTGLIVALVLVGLVVVLGIVAVIAESLARQHATALITDQVRQALALESDHPVDVTIEGPPVLWQAAGGRLEAVQVEVPRLAFGELIGDLSLRATGTPLDSQQPTDTLSAVYRVAEVDVAALAGFFSGIVVTDVQLNNREVQFQTGFSIFGIEFSIGVGVTPTVAHGQLEFSPSSLVINDQRIEASDLQSQFGPLVEPLLATQRVCVAQYLPEALELSAVQVGNTQMLVVFTAEDVALGGEGFSTRGTCS
ncbi:MAG: DUF2993 domain-containing protein, partial [Microcella sp.]|nr:DUF2993 domain-containing protein [Microcella sp.]